MIKNYKVSCRKYFEFTKSNRDKIISSKFICSELGSNELGYFLVKMEVPFSFKKFKLKSFNWFDDLFDMF